MGHHRMWNALNLFKKEEIQWGEGGEGGEGGGTTREIEVNVLASKDGENNVTKI